MVRPLNNYSRNFKFSRMQFIQQLNRADESLVSRKSLHPRLKIPMRLVDMLLFIAEHDDHHLAKMRAIRKSTEI